MSKWNLRAAAYAAFCATCLFALIWPGYAWFAGRIEPRILGLPFAFAWNISWVLASFFALALFHATRPLPNVASPDVAEEVADVDVKEVT